MPPVHAAAYNFQLVLCIQGFSVSEIQHMYILPTVDLITLCYLLLKKLHMSVPMQLEALLFKDQCVRK